MCVEVDRFGFLSFLCRVSGPWDLLIIIPFSRIRRGVEIAKASLTGGVMADHSMALSVSAPSSHLIAGGREDWKLEK